MPEPRSLSEPLPTSKLGDLPDWVLEAKCGQCRRVARIPVKLLAERHGATLRLWRMCDRLACDTMKPHPSQERCGGKPSYVWLLKYEAYGKSMRKVREIVVMDRRPG